MGIGVNVNVRVRYRSSTMIGVSRASHSLERLAQVLKSSGVQPSFRFALFAFAAASVLPLLSS